MKHFKKEPNNIDYCMYAGLREFHLTPLAESKRGAKYTLTEKFYSEDWGEYQYIFFKRDVFASIKDAEDYLFYECGIY